MWYSPWFYVKGNLKGHTQAFSPQTWSFEPTGLTVQTSASKGSVDWTVVLRVVEDGRFIYFFVSEGMAHIVPKRALEPEALTLLRRHLSQWLGPRAELGHTGEAA